VLHLHRAERADRLVAALADVLASPLADPMAAEVVAVPARGVERWLTQELATRLGAKVGARSGARVGVGAGDGVAANIDFPFPGRLVRAAVATASGIDPDTDPWLPERAVWPLLEVVDTHLEQRWLSILRRHLQGPGGTGDPPGGDRSGRRFPTVRHLAGLYDRYAVHRPDMVRAWLDGHDVDGVLRDLADDARWQAELWRRLRRHLDVPGPAERLVDACAGLRADAGLVPYPERLSLFGLTRLPASHLEVLDALAAQRDVHLFLLHPSPSLWTRLAAREPRPAAPLTRAADPTRRAPANPLLASWGGDARELQLVTAAITATDHHHALEAGAGTLLERIQADVRADREPAGRAAGPADDPRLLLDDADASLQVHACHGRARQVEVVRDAILHLLARDPTLELRDIIVMCPDIDAFAPLVQAVFGAHAPAPGAESVDALAPGAASTRDVPHLSVRLADRSLRQTNPILRVVAELLELADSRLTASQVLDLAGRDPVRQRFRLSADDLELLQSWIPAAGVRWGFDAAHRSRFKLEQVAANTWRAGLDRMLLGAAMADEDLRLVGNTLPLDDVEGGDTDVAGRFAELVDRLDAALTALRDPQPIAAWCAAIAEAARSLTATWPGEAWQHMQLHRLLAEVCGEAGVDGDAAGAAGTGPLLSLAEVRALLEDRLRGRPTRANFRTGHLTVCTLVPMRSVPHRVVCLLGLDDGAFPRGTAPDGDDLVERDPFVGDRDPRAEDRQLLLDALLAARDHLVITYTGRDERTNEPRPPAVPVGELLDVVDRTARTARVDELSGQQKPARTQVVVHHPLHPFDPRSFATGALVPGRPWSFDAVAVEGARALQAPARAAPAFLPAPLPPEPAAVEAPDVVDLDMLVRFTQHPVREFLRARLGVRMGEDDRDPDDHLPVELDGLQRWQIGTRLLEALLAGADPAACARAERARGELPPGYLGVPVLNDLGGTAQRLVEATVGEIAATGVAAEQALAAIAAAGSVEVAVPLDGGRVLAGTVTRVVGDVLLTVTFSRLAPKHRLAAWVRLLAASATRPDRALCAITVGQRGRGRIEVAHVPAVGGDPVERRDTALAHLGVLDDLHQRGLREPLPLACVTSASYAAVARAGREDAGTAARLEWTSRHDWAKEDADPEHVLVYGGQVPFDQLLAAAPAPGEEGDGWIAEERTRFGRLARRLWDGLLEAEQRRAP
jgi:exodeoxyribonuclease V gamma subunit